MGDRQLSAVISLGFFLLGDVPLLLHSILPGSVAWQSPPQRLSLSWQAVAQRGSPPNPVLLVGLYPHTRYPLDPHSLPKVPQPSTCTIASPLLGVTSGTSWPRAGPGPPAHSSCIEAWEPVHPRTAYLVLACLLWSCRKVFTCSEFRLWETEVAFQSPLQAFH